jgi:hypothetical protein
MTRRSLGLLDDVGDTTTTGKVSITERLDSDDFVNRCIKNDILEDRDLEPRRVVIAVGDANVGVVMGIA